MTMSSPDLDRRKAWTLDDRRTAYAIWFDPGLTAFQKQEKIHYALGRTVSSIQTMCSAVNTWKPGKHGGLGKMTPRQIDYIKGLVDTPVEPKVPKPEPGPEPVVDLADPQPEQVRSVMAVVEVRLNEEIRRANREQAEMALEQASALDAIRALLERVSGQLETMTQVLSDLHLPHVADNGAVAPISNFRRRNGR